MLLLTQFNSSSDLGRLCLHFHQITFSVPPFSCCFDFGISLLDISLISYLQCYDIKTNRTFIALKRMGWWKKGRNDEHNASLDIRVRYSCITCTRSDFQHTFFFSFWNMLWLCHNLFYTGSFLSTMIPIKWRFFITWTIIFFLPPSEYATFFLGSSLFPYKEQGIRIKRRMD